jgi:hypothetical protein
MNLLQNSFYPLLLKSLAAMSSLGQVKSFLRVGTLIFLVVIAAACRAGTSAPTDTTTPAGSNTGDEAVAETGGTSTPMAATTPEPAAQLNNPFVVHIGQSATLEAEAVKVTFVSVLQDIRCPSKVQCSEKGFARIQVEIQVADQEPVPYEMNTEPFFKAEMGLGVNKHEGYEVQLIGLNPAPEYPDDKLDFGSYEATFVVAKTGGQ